MTLTSASSTSAGRDQTSIASSASVIRVAEGAELEEVEQLAHFLLDRHWAPHLQRGRNRPRRTSRSTSCTQHHQLEVPLRARWPRSRRGSPAASASAPRRSRTPRRDRRTLVDQLGGGLLADARYARAGCRCCRRAVRRTGRSRDGDDAGALLDAGLVVEHVVADPALVVEHPHVRVGDQLIAVAVARSR